MQIANTMHPDYKEKISTELKDNGFVAVGFSNAELVDQDFVAKYNSWLTAGMHAEMSWLERNSEKRFDPTLLHPGTKTIITALYPWTEVEFDSGELKIAAYAHGFDYHQFLREKAKPALDFLSRVNPNHKPRFFTDSAPIPDRYWAQKAGLGFIGKNGNLIHPELGSRFFIAHIFTAISPEKEAKPLIQACGSCTKCIDACPTEAIIENGMIDSNRCISYWNIEAKTEIPTEIADKNPGWIFGCDICQMVCPYNKISLTKYNNDEMKGRWKAPENTAKWRSMSENAFELQFGFTPLARAGLHKIVDTLNGLKNTD